MISEMCGFKYDLNISADTRQPSRMIVNSDSSFTAMMYAIDASIAVVFKLHAVIAFCHDSQNLPAESPLANMPTSFSFRDNFIKSNNFVKFPLSLSVYAY